MKACSVITTTASVFAVIAGTRCAAGRLGTVEQYALETTAAEPGDCGEPWYDPGTTCATETDGRGETTTTTTTGDGDHVPSGASHDRGDLTVGHVDSSAENVSTAEDGYDTYTDYV